MLQAGPSPTASLLEEGAFDREKGGSPCLLSDEQNASFELRTVLGMELTFECRGCGEVGHASAIEQTPLVTCRRVPWPT